MWGYTIKTIDHLQISVLSVFDKSAIILNNEYKTSAQQRIAVLAILICIPI